MAMNWKIKPRSSLTTKLAKELSIAPLLAQLLVNRGIDNKESARAFLSPRLSDMADPRLLTGMEEAVDVIYNAVCGQEPITIYGDYDADGLTGAALLYHFFKQINVPSRIYVPNRLTEGYGLNGRAIERIARERRGVLITVDCGISNMKEVAIAKRLGLKVVITDHHKIPADSNFLCPTVNPHREDSLYPDQNLAGVGVAFLLAVAVRSRLREKGYFKNHNEPEIKDLLDLVAIGTIADQVALIGQNRAFVRQGLACLKHTKWNGLKALLMASCVDPLDIDPRDIAFRIAPRLNAPGRISSPNICVRLLTDENIEVNEQLATEINQANAVRQRLEQNVLGEIYEAIERDNGQLAESVLVFGGEGWHEGVLGIVASRLVDSYSRPALVLTFEGEMAKGSGRSIDQFDLYEAISQLESLFERFGGHSHAAGFALKRKNFHKLKRAISEIGLEKLQSRDLRPVLEIDAEIDFSDVSWNLIKEVEALAPFGNGNPEPLFCTRSAEIVEARVVGEKHLKMLLRQDGKIYDAIGFSMGNRKPKVGHCIDIAYTPQLNRWQGHENIQLRLIDFRSPTT